MSAAWRVETSRPHDDRPHDDRPSCTLCTPLRNPPRHGLTSCCAGLAPTLRHRYHTGFFFKLWDQLADTEYTGKCTCAKCDREAGNRTVEAWNSVEKPDYGVLLSPAFWLQGEKAKVK